MLKAERVVTWCAWSLVLAVPSACGGPQKEDQTFESYGEFLDAYYDALCEYLEQCAGIEVTGSYAWEYCTDRRADLVAAFGVDQARVNIDSNEAQTCLAKVRRAGCSFNPLEPAGCDHVVVGTVPADSACMTSAECVPDLFCDQLDMCPGKCSPRAKLGEVCTVAECQSGLLCIAGACVEEPSAGKPCVSGECGPTAYCRDDLCHPFTPYAVQVGERCEFSVECYGGNYCDYQGLCVALGAADSDCTDVPCGEGLFCSNFTCQPERQDRETCADSIECRSNHCDQGKCKARGAVGAACSSDEQCLSYNCGSQYECVPLLSCE